MCGEECRSPFLRGLEARALARQCQYHPSFIAPGMVQHKTGITIYCRALPPVCLPSVYLTFVFTTGGCNLLVTLPLSYRLPSKDENIWVLSIHNRWLQPPCDAPTLPLTIKGIARLRYHFICVLPSQSSAIHHALLLLHLRHNQAAGMDHETLPVRFTVVVLGCMGSHVQIALLDWHH